MPTKRIGGQPPRYSFILNTYSDVRVSKCPLSSRPTSARKFALFIHVDGFGPLVLGKTCRYCAQNGLNGGEGQVAATVQQVADFKKVLTLQVDPGGWGPV
jgi:hypothetical protein